MFRCPKCIAIGAFCAACLTAASGITNAAAPKEMQPVSVMVPITTSLGDTATGSLIRVEMADPNSEDGGSFVGDLDAQQIRLERERRIIAALGLKDLLEKD